ncbi:MAG: DUF4838 domain-containing protein [Pirellulales bacterium]|nr:DUF4838 domain-containing protein [Pirellulales bacterium]
MNRNPMHRTWPFAAIVFAGMACGSFARADDSAPLELAADGKTSCKIHVAEGATVAEQHAANELALLLHEITGATFLVEQTSQPPAPDVPAILVGPGACRDVADAQELARLGPEGYLLRRAGQRLCIVGGRPRGTLYGVYSFLEDELGCRWFTPEVAKIPHRERIVLGSLDRSFVPRFEYRATDYPNSRDGDWASRNKLNGTHTSIDEARGGKISYGAFVHTFNQILDPAQHFAEHPEYFSEVKGKRIDRRTQLCVTNPEVLRITIDAVRRWMRERPEATIFSVSQNDWFNYCTCAECSRVAAEEGSPIGPYLRYVNAVADAVRDEFPDKVVDTLAYQFTRKPPRLAVPRDNMIVRLCSIECCFSHPLAPDSPDRPNAAFAGDLVAWSKICQRLYIWDYVINYANCLMPFPNLRTIGPNLRFFANHGVRGVYEEANYFSQAGELAELRTWLIAKLLWNPDYDSERAIDEFLAGYYEEAAPALRKYIDLVHERAGQPRAHFRIFDSPPRSVFNREFIAQAEGLFAEALQSVRDKPLLSARVERASLSVRYLKIVTTDSLSDAASDVTTLQQQLEQFDRIARANGLTHVSEHRSYDDWLGQLRAKLSATPGK